MPIDLPPRYVNLPPELVARNPEISDAIQHTGARIYMAGWRYNYTRTPPMTKSELMELTGLKHTQLFAHLRVLSECGVLRYAYDRSVGHYKFELLLGGDSREHSSENRTESTIHGVVCNSSKKNPKKPFQKDTQQPFSVTEGGSGGKRCQSGKPNDDQSGKANGDLRQILSDRVAARVEAAYPADAVGWVVEAYRRGLELGQIRGPGWVVWALENEAEAREIVASWPDPEPDPNDRNRYISGQYAECIRH